MSPFFHFVGKTKILLPPPPLQIKGVATNASMEVNGPFSAPFLTYPLRSKQATQKKKSATSNRVSMDQSPRAMKFPLLGTWQGGNVDGAVQPQPAFPPWVPCRGRSVVPEVSHWRLAQRRCSHPASPPAPSPLLRCPQGSFVGCI